MKTNKQITIDVELMEKLRGLDNASALINRLLKEYFEIRSDKSSLLEEKQAILDQIKQKKKKIAKDIRIIAEWEALGFDHYCKNWLKTRGQRPTEYEIKQYIKGRELDIPIEVFLKGYDMLNKFKELCK